jgi:hypothetical protein
MNIFYFNRFLSISETGEITKYKAISGNSQVHHNHSAEIFIGVRRSLRSFAVKSHFVNRIYF